MEGKPRHGIVVERFRLQLLWLQRDQSPRPIR